jgi:sugar lactone lactonase YvrE
MRLARLKPAACVLALLAAAAAGASQPRFFEFEGPAPFLAGQLDGLSVDAEGHVSLAPAARELFDTATPYVWALAADSHGALFAGTGNEGQVFRVKDGKGAPFFKADELEIHALAVGPDGRLYAASSPDGKVYAVDASGQGAPFFDPPEKYIWALAFDPQGRLLVATGGEARLHRVDRQGQSEVLFSSPETHFTSLAVDRQGRTYLGSAPGGVVFRVDAPGRAFVLADTAFSEVKALAAAPDGTLYAALFEGGAATPAADAGVATVTAGAGAQVTISETFAVPPGVAPATVTLPAAGAPATGGQRGAVMRFHEGDSETLWTSTEAAPHALLARESGALCGTGDQGQVFRVDDDQGHAMQVAFSAQQVTALALLADGAVAVATSNPGKLHLLSAQPRASGSFTSAVQDAGSVAAFGRVRFDARRPDGTRVELRARSGNTQSADSTWSDWSDAGESVKSPRARYLQVQAVLHGTDGRTPWLDSLGVAYLQRNLRPQVQTLTVHPAGQVFQKPLAVSGEIEVLGLEKAEGDAEESAQAAQNTAMAVSPYNRKLTRRGIQPLSWKADDPNQDTLVYDLWFRRAGGSRFRPLRQGLTEPVYAWDTTSLPDGRYVVKLVARDTPSNPPGLALAGERESRPFEIDNTPPSLVLSLVERSPARVRLAVRDGGSPIARVEYAVDGQRWAEIYPQDGISDAPEETFEFSPALPSAPGPHVVVVRVVDRVGNFSSSQVDVP